MLAGCATYLAATQHHKLMEDTRTQPSPEPPDSHEHETARYLRVKPKELATPLAHAYLLGAVSPRPIAFASTLDADGRVNLAPFSYFNVFSTKPPLLIFSPNRSGKTGKQKDTALNARAVPEVVINVVTYPMVQQMNVTAGAFAPEVNEFEKAGLTMLPSEVVKPPRVAESPIQMECSIREVMQLSDQPGAGNLVMCEVELMHINEAVLNSQQRIDPYKVDFVGRMGGATYARCRPDALFDVARPQANAIGFEGLPAAILYSAVLTGNDLGKLANVEGLPTTQLVEEFAKQEANNLLQGLNRPQDYHRRAQELLAQEQVRAAWLVLLSSPEAEGLH